MTEGQKKFFDYILERVEKENHGKAEELLNESFSKQADGTFDSKYIQSFIPRMMELIKKEYKDEVEDIMMNY